MVFCLCCYFPCCSVLSPVSYAVHRQATSTTAMSFNKQRATQHARLWREGGAGGRAGGRGEAVGCRAPASGFCPADRLVPFSFLLLSAPPLCARAHSRSLRLSEERCRRREGGREGISRDRQDGQGCVPPNRGALFISGGGGGWASAGTDKTGRVVSLDVPPSSVICVNAVHRRAASTMAK